MKKAHIRPPPEDNRKKTECCIVKNKKIRREQMNNSANVTNSNEPKTCMYGGTKRLRIPSYEMEESIRSNMLANLGPGSESELDCLFGAVVIADAYSIDEFEP